MEKEFIPYEQALALKELGFDEPCFATFFSVGAWQIDCVEGTLNLKSNTDGEYSILAPLYQQAFRWFREKSYSCSIDYDDETNSYQYKYVYMNNGYVFSKKYNTYEQAELECLKKLIEIVKENVDKQR
jgi:hypothetical protein